MDMLAELHALLRNSGLDQDEIATRLDFLDWSSADAVRLQQAGGDFTAVHQQFVEQLDEHLGQFAAPATLLQAMFVDQPARYTPVC